MGFMEQLAWDIGETAHALRRAFERRASELGVTRAQWRVLAHLDHKPGQRQVDLAERMDIEPITLCRIVDKLEDAKLVERRRDPADRRAYRLYLCDSAAPLVTKLHALGEAFSADAFGSLSSKDIESARAVLAMIRNNLSGMTPRTKASA